MAHPLTPFYGVWRHTPHSQKEQCTSSKAKETTIHQTALEVIKNIVQTKLYRDSDFEVVVIPSQDDQFHAENLTSSKGQVGVIHVPKSTLEEAEKGNLCNSCKFTLLHELAHVVFNDSSTGERFTVHSINSLVTTGAFCYSYSITNNSLLAYTISAITSYAACKLSTLVKQLFFHREQEVRADAFAIQGDKKAALGGFYLFHSKATRNIMLKQEFPKEANHIDKGGNDLLDIEHPPLTTRAAYIFKAAKLTDKEVDEVRDLTLKQDWNSPIHYPLSK